MRYLLLLGCLLAPVAHATSCTAASGDTRARLVELYTSEGCSSCPPADRWLSALPVSDDVVPLAFHVDYWDRLGWRDPFGQAAFSQRQRARNRGAGWVYTPQVMLDGKDWRAWYRGLPPPAMPAQARLALTLTHSPQQIATEAAVRFAAPATGNGARLYFALYENRLASSVADGENAGRTLRHDYVVRELAGPYPPGQATHRFTLKRGWKPADLGVAAFVLDADGNTVQALARVACP